MIWGWLLPTINRYTATAIGILDTLVSLGQDTKNKSHTNTTYTNLTLYFANYGEPLVYTNT